MSTSTSESNKRKRDEEAPTKPGKRIKIIPNAATGTSNPSAAAPATEPTAATVTNVKDSEPKPAKKPRNIRKLVAPRPFPTVSAAVSATGPRSAHAEGRNFVCVTRKTPLGAYMRRCKDMIMKDGYKTLHLSAMGAAIPLLVKLSVALPPILPFGPNEITTQISTGTCDVHDEILPEEAEEEKEGDIEHQTRSKSTLTIVIKVGDGERELVRPSRKTSGKRVATAPTVGGDNNRGSKSGKKKQISGADGGQPQMDVFEEPDQDDMEVV